MRLVLVLLVAAAMSFAGCFGKSDNANPDNGAGTDTNTTTPTTTTPGGTNTTGTGTTGSNTTTTVAPTPRDVCTVTVDFSSQTPSPSATDPSNPFPPIVKDCAVPAGYTKLTMNVTWTTSQAAGPYVGQQVTVTLKDPAKASVGACNGPAPGDQMLPAPCKKEGVALPAGGAYKIEGTGGVGQVTATVKISAS